MITATKENPMSAAKYHSLDRLSASRLSLFRRNRRKFYLQHVAKTLPPDEPSEAMQLGTLLHCLLLEPDEYASRFTVAPACDRRTKEGKAIWQEFCEGAGDKTLIKSEVWEQAARMSAAVLQSPLAAPFLLDMPGQVEHSILWEHLGIPLKSRLDKLCDNVIVDVKTAKDASPEAFAKSVANYGYNAQAAFYRRAAGVQQFVFVVVESVEPFRVAVFDLDAEALELGDLQNLSALQQYAYCRDNDLWQDDYERRVTTLSLPRWAAYVGDET